jgi:hypothetical protein
MDVCAPMSSSAHLAILSDASFFMDGFAEWERGDYVDVVPIKVV